VIVVQPGGKHFPATIRSILLLRVPGVVRPVFASRRFPLTIAPQGLSTEVSGWVWRLFRSSNLRAVEPVVHLGVSLQIPVAIYHRDLRRPRDLDDLGIEQRVSSLLYTAVSCSPHACRCSQEKTIWECQNGGQLWGDSANAGYANTASFPDGVCAPGFQSLYTAFIVSLLVDLAFQVSARAACKFSTLPTCFASRCTCSSSTGGSPNVWNTIGPSRVRWLEVRVNYSLPCVWLKLPHTGFYNA
jgi:hypothetical protein